MYDARSNSDAAEEGHECLKIYIAHDKAQNLKKEIELCAGAVSEYTGDTAVEVYLDPTISEGDPTKPPDFVSSPTDIPPIPPDQSVTQ